MVHRQEDDILNTSTADDKYKNMALVVCVRSRDRTFEKRTGMKHVKKSCIKCKHDVYPTTYTIKEAEKKKCKIGFMCDQCALVEMRTMKDMKIEITDKTSELLGLPKDVIASMTESVLEHKHELKKMEAIAG